MFVNQVGDLHTLPAVSRMPNLSNDFDLAFGASGKWGLGFLLHTQDNPGGRPAGSASWAGLFNSYFWIDPSSGLCAVVATQVLPFCDTQTIELLQRFERTIYFAFRH